MRAVLTEDGYLFLEIAGVFTDGDQTLTEVDLNWEGFEYEMIDDVTTRHDLTARVIRMMRAIETGV